MDNSLAATSAMKTGSVGHYIDEPPVRKKQLAFGPGPSGLDPILELENALNEKLQVNDDDLDTSSDSRSDDTSSPDDENTSNPDTNTDGPTMLSKSATFSAQSCSEGTESGLGRSLSLPTDLKLVSALKGGREKEGVPKKKLSVTWAPDVYDPPPTSVSHYPKRQKHHQQYSKSYKKHGKGKHKSKNVHAGGGGGGGGGSGSSKEKKHHSHRKSKTSDRSLSSLADTERVLQQQGYNPPPSMEYLDFNDPGIGSSPDPNCGSKFLGQASGGTMHCVF